MSLLDLFANLSLGLLSILLFAWYFPAPNSVRAEPGVSKGEKQKFPSSFGIRMIYLGLQNKRKKACNFPHWCDFVFHFTWRDFNTSTLLLFYFIILPQRERRSSFFSLHLWNVPGDFFNLLGKLSSFSLEKSGCFWGHIEGWSQRSSHGSFLFIEYYIFLLLFSHGDP